MSKQRSVAIISSQAFSLSNFRGTLIRELVVSGVAVYALAPDYEEGSLSQMIKLGAKPISYSTVRTGMNPFRDLLDLFRLTVLLRRLRPDVTFGYFIKPVIFGSLAAWMSGVPRRIAMIEGLGWVFAANHHSSSLRTKLIRWGVRQLYRVALKRAHAVVFLNGDDINEFVSGGIVERSSAIELGGIGVDLQEWRCAPPSLDPVTFMLAARLLREKGIEEFAEAARIVKGKFPAVRFLLLGGIDSNPGGLRQSEVDVWVKEGLLEWHGHVGVQPWMTQTSVYVLPSYYREGVPRSSQEAMAMGRPVVTTDTPGCRDTVIEGVNGFLVPARDVNALAQALFRFVETPSLIESMGRESRLLAEVRFDARKINARLIQILVA